MRAESLVEYGKPLKQTESQTPRPTGAQVLVKVTHCGVCHSDVHIQDGYFDLGQDKTLDVRHLRNLPFILGHEIAGTVEALGPEANGIEIGARRVVYPWIGCGECANCARGAEHYCSQSRHLGLNCDGGFAEYVLVAHPRYLIDYGDISPGLAGTYMCSGLTAFSALKQLGEPQKKDTLLLVGLGGVGMMGLNFAKALFAANIIVADIDEAKLDHARAQGITAYNTQETGVFKKILTETGGGVFGAADFVGSEHSLNFAFNCLSKGGKVIVSGMFGGTFSLPVVMFPIRVRGIMGSFIGSLEDAHEMMALVRAGKVPPIPLEERSLHDASKTLDDLRAGKIVGRVILRP